MRRRLIGATVSIATAVLFVIQGLAMGAPAYQPVNPTQYYAGRLVSSAGHVLTEARTTWTVPTYSGSCHRAQYSGALFGVQVWLSAGDYVAVGTNLTCDHGIVEHSAFYAFGAVYQKGFVLLPVTQFPSLTIHAGDHVFGEINETSCRISHGTGAASYSVKIIDLTSGSSASASFTFLGERACFLADTAVWGLTTAVWANGATQPLAKFSGVTFVKSEATIGGVSGGVHSFSQHQTLTLFNQANSQIEASLAWTSHGSNTFSVIWRNSGS